MNLVANYTVALLIQLNFKCDYFKLPVFFTLTQQYMNSATVRPTIQVLITYACGKVNS